MKSIHDHVRIHTILFWAGFAIVGISSVFSKPLQPHWLMWVGIVIFLASPVYRLIKIRCPHCGSNLFSCRVIPKHCPDCGKELTQQSDTNENEKK